MVLEEQILYLSLGSQYRTRKSVNLLYTESKCDTLGTLAEAVHLFELLSYWSYFC